MVKRIISLVKLDHLTDEEFVNYWVNVHAPLVRKLLPGIRRYVINTKIDFPTNHNDFDGVSELWFDDMDSVRKCFASPEAEIISQDEPNFIKSFSTFMVEENVVLDGTVSARVLPGA